MQDLEWRLKDKEARLEHAEKIAQSTKLAAEDAIFLQEGTNKTRSQKNFKKRKEMDSSLIKTSSYYSYY